MDCQKELAIQKITSFDNKSLTIKDLWRDKPASGSNYGILESCIEHNHKYKIPCILSKFKVSKY